MLIPSLLRLLMSFLHKKTFSFVSETALRAVLSSAYVLEVC